MNRIEKVAVFPGTFEPITVGHEDVVRRFLPLFDRIIIAIGVNSKKKTFFSLEQRKEWIKDVFSDLPNVEVDHFEGLTDEYGKRKGARYLLRGLRSSADFEYEKTISQVNFELMDEMETVFLTSRPQYSHISSTIIREIIAAGGDVSGLIPSSVKLK